MLHALLFAAVAAAIPSFVLAAPIVGCTRSYTVVSGDTCDQISAANNVSTYQLMQVNDASIDVECSNLQIGQDLCLGISGSDCTATYTVVDGDICQSVSGNNGIDLDTLMANNPNIDTACSNIYPGEVLCVASQVMVDGSGTANVAPAPAAEPAPAATDSAPLPASADPTPASDPSSDSEPTPVSGTSPAAPTPTDDPDEEDLPDCEDDEDDGEQ